MFPMIVLASMIQDPTSTARALQAVPRVVELNRRAEELNKRMDSFTNSAIKHAKMGLGLAKHLVEKSGLSENDPLVLKLKKTSEELKKEAEKAKSQPLKKLPQR